MFLSNRDIKWHVETELLILAPRPEQTGTGYDETSVDLHLDSIDEARIWDVERLRASEAARGSDEPVLRVGRFDWASFATQYLIAPPQDRGPGVPVFREGRQIWVRPHGFLLWQTKEVV